MYGDFSRRPSSTGKQFKGVLMQQGRVQLDADWNAQQDLDHHRTETESVDVIGRTGAPKGPGGGFGITLAGGQLTIGAGRYYVEGRLLENAATVAVGDQPFAPGTALPAQDGVYLVYLDVFERTVSVIEDPSLREVALGGPDTTVRTQVAWRVGLQPIADAQAPTHEAALAALRAPLTGRMRAQAVPVVAQDRPCLVPAEARYRRLDNLLYRVEVQRAPNGNEQGATFKWSRDNGSMASEVRAVNGATLVLSETARDDLVRFEQGAWVEVLDDRMEWSAGVGVLRRLAAPTDHARSEITLDQPVAGLDLAARPRVRLWNHEGNVPDGVPFTNGWTAVEAGIEVRFEPGTYRPGDYWLVPARAALGGPNGVVRDRTGDIEWATDAGVPRAEPRRGIEHHYAALAVVERAAGAWGAPSDLRLRFPPLTAITARDVSYDNSAGLLDDADDVQEAIDALAQRDRGNGDCSVVIRQGDDIAARLTEIPGGRDGRVCFLPGRYVIAQTVELANRGHLIFTGAGPGTVIVASGAESALRFTGCESVAVRDLQVSSGIGQGAGNAGLRGALHFEDCASVVVERVRITTRSQTSPHTAGVTVARARTARICCSEIAVGDQQHGVLLVDVQRSRVEDNWIGVDPAAQRAPWRVRLQDRRVLRRLQKIMIARARLGAAAGDETRARVSLGGVEVTFETPPALRRAWAGVLAASPPRAPVTSERELLAHIERLSLRVLRGEGVIAGNREMRAWFRQMMRGEQATGSKAIIVAGVTAEEARVQGNRVSRFAAGIVLGLSDHRPGQHERRVARRVWIRDNALDLWLPSDTRRDVFGIFVGNCRSLHVEANSVRYERGEGTPLWPFEGIRIYGELGPLVVVRGNECFGPQIAVRFVPIQVPQRAQWVVTDNVADAEPVARFGDPARGVSASAVSGRVRGEEHNVSV